MPIPSPANSRRSRPAFRTGEAYCRTDILPGLLGLWPREVEDYSAEGTLALILKLKRALRAERKRGQARSFTYDLNRHMRLVSALKRELAFLAELSQGTHARNGRRRSEVKTSGKPLHGAHPISALGCGRCQLDRANCPD